MSCHYFVFVPVFQVCYTQGKYIQVRVHSEVFDPLTRQHSTTNIFHYTFASDRDVPSVIPQTYGGEPVLVLVLVLLAASPQIWLEFVCFPESMLYLDGKRHFNQTLESWWVRNEPQQQTTGSFHVKQQMKLKYFMPKFYKHLSFLLVIF